MPEKRLLYQMFNIETHEGLDLVKIKHKFKRLIKMFHPDKCPSNSNLAQSHTEITKGLIIGYGMLKEKGFRFNYYKYSDQSLDIEESARRAIKQTIKLMTGPQTHKEPELIDLAEDPSEEEHYKEKNEVINNMGFLL